MPSKSTLITVAWTIVIFAALMRVEAAHDIILND